MQDWEQFVFKYEQYKTLARVTKDYSSRAISSQTEANMLQNI